MRKPVIYRNYIDKKGVRLVIMEMLERSSNLSGELSKFLQYKKNIESLQHAVADMEIGVEMMKKILNPNDINRFKGKKLKQITKKC